MASSLAVCSENNDTFISSPAAALASLQITQLTHNHDMMVLLMQEGKTSAFQEHCYGPLKADQQKDFV